MTDETLEKLFAMDIRLSICRDATTLNYIRITLTSFSNGKLAKWTNLLPNDKQHSNASRIDSCINFGIGKILDQIITLREQDDTRN